jgi:CheY-like chemotaxis protein
MIDLAAQRGSELTRRLLAFARKQALDPKAVDIDRLIGGMEGLLRRSLGEHIEISFAFSTDPWPAMVDPGQLEGALLNLAINARDAMPAGGKLTIETVNVELDAEYTALYAEVQPGAYVLLVVSDTGSGIAPEHLERVFEPFYTTKEKGHGTGLGLSMVYGFVKQSNGHITLYSEPGVGTTVKMYLPRSAHAVGLAAELETRLSGGNELILLVEDDELVRTYSADQLRSLGYRVLTAENGHEALAILGAQDDIDLLFTDIVMPGGMNGRELADAARTLHPGLKVLYTSGYTENAIVHHGRLDPGVQLLSKPYGRQEISRRIREVLAGT